MRRATRIGPRRVLAVCNLDLMAWMLLRPWLAALQRAGFEVHIACAMTKYAEQLAGMGFLLHPIPFASRSNPLAHLRPLWMLWRLLRRERFYAVNTHSPAAAAVGRLAAWLAGAPHIIYTVHAFYFHDRMPWARWTLCVAIEWLLGAITDCFLFASAEDAATARRLGIARRGAGSMTIYDGIALDTYPPRPWVPPADAQASGPVIGIVARIVREKGFEEFLHMARRVAPEYPAAKFLVVGDGPANDRNRFAAEFRRRVAEAGLEDRFEFTGMTNQVARHLQRMDVFVLPSHREGFPRSVLEAMSSALPVVTTNIRGCREAVIDGVNGRIVPPADGEALAGAVLELLADPERARRMGRAGRQRVEELFNESLVARAFVSAFDWIAGEGVWSGPRRQAALAAKRTLDLAGALALSLVLLPVLAGAALAVWIAMGRPVLFRQRRQGFAGREFEILKFRTMREARGGDGRLLADDERLTVTGNFLRRTSIDELPQLWNVIRGEMSLVGPRPQDARFGERYSAEQRRRLQARPGITGWAQINGRNELSWEQKFALDVWYVDHWNFALDLKILAETVGPVLKQKGVSAPGHATCPEFLGTPADAVRQGGGEWERI